MPRSSSDETKAGATSVWALVVGVATVLLALESGGYYPGTTADATFGALVAVAICCVMTRGGRGLGRGALSVAVPLAGFAGWTLLSQEWSHAPARALIACDRVVLYLSVFLVFALAGRRDRVRALLLGSAAAMWAVCVVGLAAYLAPDVIHVSAQFVHRRMSYPTGYWNANGLLAAFGALWGLHLCCAWEERPAWRVAGAAAIVPCVAVIGFSASRGAAASAVAGALVYLACVRSRSLLVGGPMALLATVAGALAVHVAGITVQADVLTAPAVSHDHRAAGVLVALTCLVAAARAVALVADRRLATARLARVTPRVRIGIAALAVGLVVVMAVAADAPHRLSSAGDQFIHGKPDLVYGGARFTSLSGDGRAQIWQIALRHGLAAHPLNGSGAGTFPLLWAEYRPVPADAPTTQSLFVETVSELGIVGGLLLGAALVAAIVAVLRLVRGRAASRSAWAAMVAGVVAWLVFAAIDYDWELPAASIWMFATFGLAVARPTTPREPRGARAGSRRRRMVGAGAVALAGLALAFWMPLRIERSDADLVRADASLRAGDCRAAAREGAAAHAALGSRPEPLAIVAVCQARAARFPAARRTIAAAIAADPRDWQSYDIEGLIEAAAGERPGALGAARARGPSETPVLRAERALRAVRGRRERRIARRLPLPQLADACTSPSRVVLPVCPATAVTIGGR
jgi:hypothetical protein